MKKLICTVCGYIHKGKALLKFCPLCKSASDNFIMQVSEGMVWSDEHVVGIGKDANILILEKIRANFFCECINIGTCLVMGHQADKEGYPEIAHTYKRIAFEKVDHASKFAELLGEVLMGDVKKNLQTSIDKEYGTCNGKDNLFILSKKLGLDEICEIISNTCRDEVRHGEALEGILYRNFMESSII